MGQIVAPFGIKGWLRLRVYTEEIDSLTDYPTWWLEQDRAWRPYVVEDAAISDKGLRAKLADIADRGAAELLRGCQIGVPKVDLPETQDGEFYWRDLVGLEVSNLYGERLGVIESLIETGASDVLVVHGERERLIPSPMITGVDLEARRVIVDWGLDY
jgi:16S rRNA processing protein RimM